MAVSRPVNPTCKLEPQTLLTVRQITDMHGIYPSSDNVNTFRIQCGIYICVYKVLDCQFIVGLEVLLGMVFWDILLEHALIINVIKIFSIYSG